MGPWTPWLEEKAQTLAIPPGISGLPWVGKASPGSFSCVLFSVAFSHFNFHSCIYFTNLLSVPQTEAGRVLRGDVFRNALWTGAGKLTHYSGNCYYKAKYGIVATRLRDEVLKWMVGGGEGKVNKSEKDFQQSVIRLRWKWRQGRLLGKGKDICKCIQIREKKGTLKNMKMNIGE